MTPGAAPSVIKPLAPRDGLGWEQLAPPPMWITLGYPGARYYHKGAQLLVISAVEVANDDDGIDRGPEYHVSISQVTQSGRPGRCSLRDAQQVLRDFGLDGAEEDNHVPGGQVRNFWRPVADRFVGMECACKDSEPAMREDKGDYVWRGVP